MLSFRETSSSSKSVTVLPSVTESCRSVATAVKRRAEHKDVFPECPCPTRATLRISAVSKSFNRAPPRQFLTQTAAETINSEPHYEDLRHPGRRLPGPMI